MARELEFDLLANALHGRGMVANVGVASNLDLVEVGMANAQFCTRKVGVIFVLDDNHRIALHAQILVLDFHRRLVTDIVQALVIDFVAW